MTNWGILACGNIARKFAQGLANAPNARLLAVASRSQEKADAFGAEFGAERRYGSYQDLANDPDIDIVYIASPHTGHCEHSILCLDSGKAVLCEKPLAINAQQVERMIAAARRNDRFLMEAMWTRFLPMMNQVRAWLDEGAIGPLQALYADFGFRAGFNPEGRLFNLDLGGGSLLDVGIYPLALAVQLFGEPNRIQAMANLSPTGSDEFAMFNLGFANGAMAGLSSAVRATTPMEATIVGENGLIRLHRPFWKATLLTIEVQGKDAVTTARPFESTGYQYEAIAAMEAMEQGLLEHPLMPWGDSLILARTMDEIRGQIGVRYPGE